MSKNIPSKSPLFTRTTTEVYVCAETTSVERGFETVEEHNSTDRGSFAWVKTIRNKEKHLDSVTEVSTFGLTGGDFIYPRMTLRLSLRLDLAD